MVAFPPEVIAFCNLFCNVLVDLRVPFVQIPYYISK